MATAWYKQVNPPQRKALFSAWLGYVFDGFDFMMIFYILHIIKADLGHHLALLPDSSIRYFPHNELRHGIYHRMCKF